MATRKILAREFTWEVESATPDAWLTIGGLQTFSITRGKTDADTKDFDSAGWAEHMVASRNISYTLDGQYKEDSADGSRDTGQERIEVLANAVGTASIGTFRYTTPGGTVVTFDASCTVDGPGGNDDDAAGWSAALTQTGQATVT